MLLIDIIASVDKLMLQIVDMPARTFFAERASFISLLGLQENAIMHSQAASAALPLKRHVETCEALIKCIETDCLTDV